LREYVIKSSYNTAITGNYVNLEMIKYLLGRGCRFLDFEIFYIDNKPVVAYSTDKNIDTIDTDNYVLLDSVLSTVVSTAFSVISPNNSDPLFIQFRIKSTNPNVYKAVAKSVDFNLRGKLYNNKITDDTKLSDLMGQIVLVMDKTINRNYKDLSICKKNEQQCHNLSNYINIESGSQSLYLQNYSELLNQYSTPPMILDKCKGNNSIHICTDISKMRVVLPDNNFKNVQNPNYTDFVSKFGSQILAYRFYVLDKNLKNYETFFDDNKSAFVPLAIAIEYIQKTNNNQ